MADLHRHTCDCGNSWEHDGEEFDGAQANDLGEVLKLEVKNIASHNCDQCGQACWLRDHPILGAPPPFVIREFRKREECKSGLHALAFGIFKVVSDLLHEVNNDVATDQV